MDEKNSDCVKKKNVKNAKYLPRPLKKLCAVWETPDT